MPIKVYLVQPLGMDYGHPSWETSRVAKSLLDKNVDVEIITYQGIRDKELPEIREVQAKSPSFLPNTESIYGTAIASFISTFKALQMAEPEDIIYVLDGFPSVVLTLFKIFQPENFIWKVRDTFEMGTPILGTWIYKESKLNFICEAETVEKDLRKVISPESKITTIPNGVPKEEEIVPQKKARDRLDLPENKKILLVFGLAHTGKSYKTIFKALSRMEKKEDYLLLFAGKVPNKNFNNPRKLSEKTGLAGMTRVFDEYIPEEKLKFYFAAADALILSYRKTFTGASGVVSNACRFQKPVIASRVGSIKERVEGYSLGLTFKPESPAQLSRKIEKFFSGNPTEYIKGTRKFSEEYNWSKIGVKYKEFFEEVKSS